MEEIIKGKFVFRLIKIINFPYFCENNLKNIGLHFPFQKFLSLK